MANMLYEHLTPVFLHIYVKTQPTVTSTSPVIAICVPETNMPIILGIYVNFLHENVEDMNIYVQHIKQVFLELCPVQSGADTHTNTLTTDGDGYRLNLASAIQPKGQH